MPATEAQIRANQANALKSSGPKTLEGKEQSRRNALKHGLTGSGVVMAPEDAAEVDRRVNAFQDELKPSGEVGVALVRRAATMAVRMERCATRDFAVQAANVRQAMDEFVAPEGVDDDEVDRLRGEAGVMAQFDPSKDANLARKYEAAAERGFFRALKELRVLSKAQAAGASPLADRRAEIMSSMAQMGSFLPAVTSSPSKPVPAAAKPLPTPSRLPSDDWDPFGSNHCDVPITIGRRR